MITPTITIEDKRLSRSILPLVSLECDSLSRAILAEMKSVIQATTEEVKNKKKNPVLPSRFSRVRLRFQILTSPIDRSNSPTLVCEFFHTIRVYHYPGQK